jgi:hypothetical protein
MAGQQVLHLLHFCGAERAALKDQIVFHGPTVPQRPTRVQFGDKLFF